MGNGDHGDCICRCAVNESLGSEKTNRKTMVMIGAKDRYVAGPKAPACGLTLVGIEYSE